MNTRLKRKVLTEKNIYYPGIIPALSNKVYLFRKCKLEDLINETKNEYMIENLNEFLICVPIENVYMESEQILLNKVNVKFINE